VQNEKEMLKERLEVLEEQIKLLAKSVQETLSKGKSIFVFDKEN